MKARRFLTIAIGTMTVVLAVFIANAQQQERNHRLLNRCPA